MKYKAVIFDMDGTILDTIEDLKNTLNDVFEQHGLDHTFTDDEVKCFFGSGIQVALYRTFLYLEGYRGEDLLQYTIIPKEYEERIAEYKKEWQSLYLQKCEEHTKPYTGIVALCEKCRDLGIVIGVVSNKPDPAVQELAKQHFGNLFIDNVMGESDVIHKKPAPDMLLKMMNNNHVKPSETLYVGDSEIDIQTARNAGCDIASVTWGFRSKTYLKSLNPDVVLHDVGALENWIQYNKDSEERI